MDQTSGYSENSSEQYQENDYSLQWKQARLTDLKIADGRSLAALGIPRKLYFGENATPFAILESLINLDKQFAFAHKHTDAWFFINQNLRHAIINQLRNTLNLLFPEYQDTIKAYPVFRDAGRYQKSPRVFDTRDGVSARHVSAMQGLMHAYNLIFSESISFDPNNILEADNFLRNFYAKLMNHISRVPATDATVQATRILELELPAGRMSYYKNLFVPCSVVIHDTWSSDHFENGVIPTSAYYAAYNNPDSTGEADQGAFNLLSMRAGGSIRRQYDYNTQDIDLDSIVIQDPPNLTNGYYIRLPIDVISKDNSQIEIENMYIIWIPSTSLGRVNPKALMDENHFIVTQNSSGELIFLTADPNQPVQRVNAYPPLTATAAEYLQADDQLTSNNPFTARRHIK